MARKLWILVLACMSVAGCTIEALDGPVEYYVEALDGPVEYYDTLPDVVDSKTLTQTDVVAHAQGEIVPGRNYLYCGTFQLAWNQMQDEIIEEPIQLVGSPPLAEVLNKQFFRREHLSEDSYLAKAGFVKDGIDDEIRAEMQRRFPAATLGLPESLDEKSVVAYAYLHKALSFSEAFDRLRRPLVFKHQGKKTQVAAFGIPEITSDSDRHVTLRSQVTVLDYFNEDDFVLKLNTLADQDELILAKIAAKKTLDATIAAVQRRMDRSSNRASPLAKGETLAIPIISLGLLHHYTELEGKFFKNQGWNEYFIQAAQQTIRFRIDEAGAQLESDAYFSASKSDKSNRPRQFVLDKPFLLYLKQTDAERPYFAMWIETPELLEAPSN